MAIWQFSVRSSLLFGLALSPAGADTIGFDAASACDPRQGHFELAAVVQHNAEFTIISNSWAGLKPISPGKHTLKCQLCSASVKIEVAVYPPANGQCGSPGYAMVRGLVINAKKVRLGDEDWVGFNAFCPDERKEATLVKLTVHKSADNDIIVSRCTATEWSWERGYSEIQCRSDRLQLLVN